MDNETLFYIFGIGLAVSAVTVSFIGLRFGKFPGKAFVAAILAFAVLVGASTTFAVLNSKDEDEAKAAEAAEAAGGGEQTAEQPAGGAQAGGEAATEPAGNAGGPGGTLQLAADPTQIAYDKKRLTSKPGEVTIDFDNPSAIQHDVAIEQGGKEIAKSDQITQGKTSVTANLAPGTYTFLCTVPGHAEAGMQGTLVVK